MMITVDGSYLEGVSHCSCEPTGGESVELHRALSADFDAFARVQGGQILRNSIALSVLLDTPVTVEKIRAGRAQGGLRPQHLTGIQLLAQLSEAKLHNGQIGATEIVFTPKLIKGGNYLADTKTAG